MPVTFRVAAHSPSRFSIEEKEYFALHPSDPLTMLAKLGDAHKTARLLQSSVDGSKYISVEKNGFVGGALLAYNQHRNLIIRPDDVWIAVLSQLNFYINAHADELRDKFVGRRGKRELVVVGVDFGGMTVQMTSEINKHVKDKSLVPWLLPDFSTTTANDTIICSALTMATMRRYFNYNMMMGCGIPQITLEGTQVDWQSILDRIDKIPEFGSESEGWAEMLHVILRRFVRAFDKGPEGESVVDKEFWERMIHHEPAGSGGSFISGWMSAFCAWNEDGKFQLKCPQKRHRMETSSWTLGVSFDGVWFPRIGYLPRGYSEVKVKVVQMGGETNDCMLLAGHVGVSFGDEKELDTVSMAPQWFMYVKADVKADEAQATSEAPSNVQRVRRTFSNRSLAMAHARLAWARSLVSGKEDPIK